MLVAETKPIDCIDSIVGRGKEAAMADVSFAHVPAEGFTAFSAHLDGLVWGSIDVSTYLGADGRLAKPIGDAPAFVMFKVQLLMALTATVVVMQSTGSAKTSDKLWDSMQKRLSGLITVGRASTDAQEKAAADRLRGLLLLGKSGEGQTRLSYQQEVDFGRKQLRLAAETSCAADIALLGLGPAMTSIAAATENLAVAIGQGRADLAPAEQRKAAVMECVQVFGTVYRALDWLAEHGHAGPDRDMAVGLRATMDELVAKYPARVAKSRAAQSPTVAAPLVA
jgi:hypothetical protein